MNYFDLGSELDYSDFNAIVYMLRKFKRLTSNLRLGKNVIISDFGTYNFTGGLTNVDGNYIIESPVTITSSDVLFNCFYEFIFTVIDVNTSGIINRRFMSVTGNTGNDGELEIILPTNLINNDEVILPDFKVNIIFDPHEYYTPVSSLNIDLSVSEQYIKRDETNTITATVTDEQGDAISGITLVFDITGTSSVVETTDENGEATITYTGTGTVGKVTVTVSQEKIVFYDGGIEAEYNRGHIILGRNTLWLVSNGDVLIDWGDGTTNTINNPTRILIHDYIDGQTDHTITFIGDITTIGYGCFYDCNGLNSITIPNSVTRIGDDCFYHCSNLISVVIPEKVTSLGDSCFNRCSDLTSVTIPDSVTSIGRYCFYDCDNLIDYQIYWTGSNIIRYDSNKMPINTNTIFTIPNGETSNYIAKNYPADKIVERNALPTVLNIEVPATLVYGDDFNITGLLTDGDDNPLSDKTVNLKINEVFISSATTDNNGEIEFTECPVSMSPLTFQLIFFGDTSYNSTGSQTVTREITKETAVLTVTNPVDNISVYSDESISVNGVLTDNDGETISGKNIIVSENGTTITTFTTGSNGEFSGSLTGLSVGTHTLSFAFAGDDYYTTSSVTRTVNVITHSYDIDVTSLTPIIQTGDTATVVATLTDNNIAVAGETLSYQIKHGSTVLDSGSDTTDANGEINITYTGTGIGDVDVIISFGLSLQETYNILDTKWFATDSDVMQWSTSSSGVNTNYNSDKVINTGETLYIKLQNIPTSVVVGAVDDSRYCQLMKDMNQLRVYWTGSSENVSGRLTTDTLIKLEVVSSNAQNWYINDTLLKQITNNTLSAPKAMIRKYKYYPVTVDVMYIL